VTGRRLAVGAFGLVLAGLTALAFWQPGVVTPQPVPPAVSARPAGDNRALPAEPPPPVRAESRPAESIAGPTPGPGLTTATTAAAGGNPAGAEDRTSDPPSNPPAPPTAAAAGPGVTQALPGAALVPAPRPAPAPSRTDSQTVVLPKDTVIGIRLDQALSGETAHVDDKITARVARDVVVDGVTAIPAGTRLEGTITEVDRSARGKRGRVGLRFTTLVRADEARLAIPTEAIFREGDPIGQSAPALNVGSGFGAVLANRGRTSVPNQAPGRAAPGPETYRDAQLPAGSLLTVHLTAPVSVVIDRHPE
jgi:hypothetical protein